MFLFLGLKASEIAEIAERITSRPLSSNDVTIIAKAFEYPDSDSLEGHDDITMTDILISWYKRNKNIQEPRRVFAGKISKLGELLSESCKSKDKQEEVKAAFIKMAKDMDVYFDPEALC